MTGPADIASAIVGAEALLDELDVDTIAWEAADGRSLVAYLGNGQRFRLTIEELAPIGEPA